VSDAITKPGKQRSTWSPPTTPTTIPVKTIYKMENYGLKAPPSGRST